MAARGPQNGRRGLERDLPLDFWALRQTSMRKIDERGDTEGVGKERIENNHGQSGQ